MSENLCRLCLETVDLLWVFDPKLPHKNTTKAIEVMCGVKICRTDTVSQMVCNVCCQITIKMFQFRTKCIKNDKDMKARCSVQMTKTTPKPKTSGPNLHFSVKEIIRRNPKLVLPKECLNCHLGGYVTLLTDEVNAYVEERGLTYEDIGMEKKPKKVERKRKSLVVEEKKSGGASKKPKLVKEGQVKTRATQLALESVSATEESSKSSDPNERPGSRVTVTNQEVTLKEETATKIKGVEKQKNTRRLPLENAARLNTSEESNSTKRVNEKTDTRNKRLSSDSAKENEGVAGPPPKTTAEAKTRANQEEITLTSILSSQPTVPPVTIDVDKPSGPKNLSGLTKWFDSRPLDITLDDVRPPEIDSISLESSKSSFVAALQLASKNADTNQPDLSLVSLARKTHTLYTCRVCHSQYSSLFSLNRHERKTHTKCTFCGENFQSLIRREKHVIECPRAPNAVLTRVDEKQRAHKKYPEMRGENNEEHGEASGERNKEQSEGSRETTELNTEVDKGDDRQEVWVVKAPENTPRSSKDSGQHQTEVICLSDEENTEPRKPQKGEMRGENNEVNEAPGGTNQEQSEDPRETSELDEEVDKGDGRQEVWVVKAPGDTPRSSKDSGQHQTDVVCLSDEENSEPRKPQEGKMRGENNEGSEAPGGTNQEQSKGVRVTSELNKVDDRQEVWLVKMPEETPRSSKKSAQNQNVICPSDEENSEPGNPQKGVERQFDVVNPEILTHVKGLDDEKTLKLILSGLLKPKEVYSKDFTIISSTNNRSKVFRNLHKYLKRYRIPIEIQHGARLAAEYRPRSPVRTYSCKGSWHKIPPKELKSSAEDRKCVKPEQPSTTAVFDGQKHDLVLAQVPVTLSAPLVLNQALKFPKSKGRLVLVPGQLAHVTQNSVSVIQSTFTMSHGQSTVHAVEKLASTTTVMEVSVSGDSIVANFGEKTVKGGEI